MRKIFWKFVIYLRFYIFASNYDNYNNFWNWSLKSYLNDIINYVQWGKEIWRFNVKIKITKNKCLRINYYYRFNAFERLITFETARVSQPLPYEKLWMSLIYPGEWYSLASESFTFLVIAFIWRICFFVKVSRRLERSNGGRQVSHFETGDVQA